MREPCVWCIHPIYPICPPQETPRCVSALALKHEVNDSREDGIDAEVLSIVPSADGTALFCGLAR